jgi:hypothetical protein
MLLQFFKGNSPGAIFLTAVIFVAVWLGPFIHPPSIAADQVSSGAMPLYGLLLSMTGKNSILAVALSFGMVVIISFLLVNFNTTSFFISERTYLPALFYVIAGGFFPKYQSLNPALPASLFLILAIIRIIDVYRKTGIANNFFDAGILISTGSLFYASLIWFGLLIMISIVLIRTINVSDIFISVLGLLTPYLITFGVYYVMSEDLGALLNLISANLFHKTGAYIFPRFTIVALILSAIIVFMTLAYLITLLNNKKIKARKTFSVLIWTFLISLAAYIILPSVSVEIIWITGIPVSYFLTHYFVFKKKKLMPEIFLTILFLLILIIQISYFR